MITVLAPYHSNRDRRVRRTMDLLAEFSNELHAFWDEAYPGHVRGDLDGVWIETYLDPGLFRRCFPPYSRRRHDVVKDSLRLSSLIYVHGAGIDGLLLAFMAKRTAPQALVILDYHDSLPYELHYQLKKRGLSALYGLAKPFYLRFVRILASRIDGFVGISRRQLEQLLDQVDRPRSTAVVPNIQAFSDVGIDRSDRSGGGSGLNLVWLGQVMLGRDLELIHSWARDSSLPIHFHVFGSVVDQRVVSALSGPSVTFHGAFNSIDELRRRIPERAVGVFLGWSDPDGTGINRIASPNKYYSYIDIGIPVIVHEHLEGQAEEIHEWGAGEVIRSRTEFLSALEKISRNYKGYAVRVRDLRSKFVEFDPVKELRIMLREISSSSDLGESGGGSEQ